MLFKSFPSFCICFPRCSASHSLCPIACIHHPVPHFNWSILLKYDSERCVGRLCEPAQCVSAWVCWHEWVSPCPVILNDVMFSYLSLFLRTFQFALLFLFFVAVPRFDAHSISSLTFFVSSCLFDVLTGQQSIQE